jgi:diguanylate cyclase
MARYELSRAANAELMRLVIPEMYRHPASFTPLNFTLWYEHFAGLNPRLSVELAEREQQGRPLADADVEVLYAKYIAYRDALATDQLQSELVRLMDQVGRLALGAGEGMAEYRAALEICATRLKTEPTVEVLHEVVDLLAERTERARGSASTLHDRLQTFRDEMQTLRSEVDTLRQQALTDPLTGLLNRRGFERAVEEFGRRPGGLPRSAVLLCDVDKFKRVNDLYGHLIGDRVLVAIARVLTARVKGRDTVARWGGEEFAVFLPETGAVDARHLADQIRSDVARGRIKRLDREDFVDAVTISIGIAETEPGESLEALLGRADAALYEAKAAGRDCVVIAAQSGATAARSAAG